MTPAEFSASLESWHDFFLAAAGASAALLGLLFVGVSINLSAIAAAERQDLRTRAEQAFANLLYVLSVSLILLTPDPPPIAIALGIGFIAVLGLVRVARALPVLGGHHALTSRRALVRRMASTVLSDLLLLWAAITYGSGDARITILVMAAVFVLVVGAADVSWEMLISVSKEGPAQQ